MQLQHRRIQHEVQTVVSEIQMIKSVLSLLQDEVLLSQHCAALLVAAGVERVCGERTSRNKHHGCRKNLAIAAVTTPALAEVGVFRNREVR